MTQSTGMKQVADFFRTNTTKPMTFTEFAAEWNKLSDLDKSQLKSAVLDGTLNY
jgi:hypothetical protein